MRRLKKVPINLILGIIVGGFVASFIMGEGNLLIQYMVRSNKEVNIRVVNVISAGLSIILFGFVVKKFYGMKRSGLATYFVLAIVVSSYVVFFIFWIGIMLFGNIIVNSEVQTFLYTDFGNFIMINATYLCVFLVISSFLVSFILFTKRKVNYIEYISKEVKTIAVEGFGKTIEVKGTDELSELSKSINRMSTQLKEKDEKEKRIEQNKNELIVNVSHDLRTPLTSIIGYVELLKENGFQDKVKFDEYIAVVDHRVRGLNTLINELFEYTKLSNYDSKLTYSEVNIVTLIAHIVNEYAYILQKEELSIEKELLDEEVLMMVDIEKIVRVMQNLLENARKYSVKGSCILVRVYQEKDEIVITVSNKTDQIKEQDLDRLFERFYKVDKSRCESESSGLGLSIVKRIVELHNGSIEVSFKEQVITFKVRLPIVIGNV